MEERIKICKTCQNKSFSDEKGIVCGLTNEKPWFENDCPDFKPAHAETIQTPSVSVANDEDLEMGFKILSFCIPLAGLILYFVHKEKHPRKSSQACTAAVWGVVVSIILNVIYYVIIASS